jgi:hypothetical protein
VKLSKRAVVALRVLKERTDVAPPASKANGWQTPRRQTYAFLVADALDREVPGRRDRRGKSGTRSATGAANTLVALRNKGLVAGGAGMVFAPAGVEAYETWMREEAVTT